MFGDGERSDAEHTDAEHSAEHDGPRGTMRFQDPDSTTRRQPTLSERHARQQAERQEAEAARRAAEEHEAAALRAQRRKRMMIGGGVTVGVVALVGGWYLFASPERVSARCAVSTGATRTPWYPSRTATRSTRRARRPREQRVRVRAAGRRRLGSTATTTAVRAGSAHA